MISNERMLSKNMYGLIKDARGPECRQSRREMKRLLSRNARQLEKARITRIAQAAPSEKEEAGLREELAHPFNGRRALWAALAAGAALAIGCGSVVSDDEDRADIENDVVDVQEDVPVEAPDADVGPEADVGPDVPAEAEADVPAEALDSEADVGPDVLPDADSHEDAPDADVGPEAEVEPDVPVEADSAETVDTYDCTEMSRTETRTSVETETLCGRAPTTTDVVTITWNEGPDCTDTTEREFLDSRQITFPFAYTSTLCMSGDLVRAPNGFEVIIETNASLLNSAAEVSSTRGSETSRLVVGSTLGAPPEWSITATEFFRDNFSATAYDGIGGNRGNIQVYGTPAASRAALGTPYTELPMAPDPVTRAAFAFGMYAWTSSNASIIRLPTNERVNGSTENLLGPDGTTTIGTCTFNTMVDGSVRLTGYAWACARAKK